MSLPPARTPNTLLRRTSPNSNEIISRENDRQGQHDSEIDSSSSSSEQEIENMPESVPLSRCKNSERVIGDGSYRFKMPSNGSPNTGSLMVVGIGVALSIIIACGCAIVLNDNENCEHISIKEIKEKFPSQSEYTFDAIASGVNEVKLHNKPSMFVFLYESDAIQTVESFVQVVARYASNILNEDCKSNPIILTSSSFNAHIDYGHIVSSYKPILEERTVMIVKNLDKVPGITAQAFHCICDEHAPLVPKSLIMFTIEITKTNKKYKSDYDRVEKILKESWSDLDDDTFYPLFTRISSMVLKIEP